MLRNIGIIPDGNRRYSRKSGLSLEKAYLKGFEKAEEVFDWCLGVPGLKGATVYALSTENLGRSDAELEILSALYEKYLGELARSKRIHENEVRVRVIGRAGQLNGLSGVVDELHAATAAYGRYDLNIALAYGGRAEIMDAVQRAYREGKIAGLDEENFPQYLYQPAEIDLLIRTGGNHRLSNFMPWQATYAELYFTEKLWPEFSRKDFDAALRFYSDAKRNFGR